jgi:hypothetical protein
MELEALTMTTAPGAGLHPPGAGVLSLPHTHHTLRGFQGWGACLGCHLRVPFLPAPHPRDGALNPAPSSAPAPAHH